MVQTESGETELVLPDLPKTSLFGWRKHRRRFALDMIGVFVWNLCDGAHTVESISTKVAKEFKMHRLESEVALTSFLQMLASRDLIRFKGVSR